MNDDVLACTDMPFGDHRIVPLPVPIGPWYAIAVRQRVILC